MLGSGSAPPGPRAHETTKSAEAHHRAPTAWEAMKPAKCWERLDIIDRPQTQPARLQPSTRLASGNRVTWRDTGIFFRMFSEPYPTDGGGMTELGDRVPAAACWRHQGCALRHRRLVRNWRRDDFRPCAAGVCQPHPTGIWARKSPSSPETSGTSIKDKGATEIDWHLRLRIKRHHAGDPKISPTRPGAAIEFWQPRAIQPAFPGAGRGSVRCCGLSVGP